LSEQKRIAAILDKADAIRRKRRSQLASAMTLMQSVFTNLFGGSRDIIHKWDLRHLGKHLTFLTSGSRGWAQYYARTGKRFIRSFDVQMNELNFHDPAYVNPPLGAETDRTRVRYGDVLLTITGSKVGRVAFVEESVGEAYVSQHVAILRTDQQLNHRFLSMYLSLPTGGQLQIRKVQYGQTKPGLSLENIRTSPLPIPPGPDQDRFVSIWMKFVALIQRLGRAESKSDNLFHSLVQRSFRGKL